MDAIRQQLKIFSRQYNLYMKSSVAPQSNLISLADKVFPGVNKLFSSPERADGHLKWVDFVTTFWHCECISWVSEKAFVERYQKWCKHQDYNFSAAKAADIYTDSLGHIVTLPKNDNTKLLIQTAAKELTAMNELLAIVAFAGIEPEVNQSGKMNAETILPLSVVLRICEKRCTKS